MTNEQVIKNLEDQCWEVNSICDCKGKECGNCHLATAIKAIEKQIPKKPIRVRFITDESHNKIEDGYACPICIGETGQNMATPIGFDESYKMEFCYKCGQAIDWSEDD